MWSLLVGKIEQAIKKGRQPSQHGRAIDRSKALQQRIALQLSATASAPGHKRKESRSAGEVAHRREKGLILGKEIGEEGLDDRRLRLGETAQVAGQTPSQVTVSMN